MDIVLSKNGVIKISGVYKYLFKTRGFEIFLKSLENVNLLMSSWKIKWKYYVNLLTWYFIESHLLFWINIEKVSIKSPIDKIRRDISRIGLVFFLSKL